MLKILPIILPAISSPGGNPVSLSPVQQPMSS